MSDISQRITALSPTKRELLLKLIQSKKEIDRQSVLTNLASFCMTVEELKAEANLAPEIYPTTKNIGFIDQPKSVLLTGATGFVGAFLLDEILQQTQANVYCLVRANDIIQGKQRIQKNLESYLIWDESKTARIIPVLGDLTQPLLGLESEQFQIMSNEIDVIYHCGALVKWTYPYNALKAANVFGTHEIIRLACQNKVKPIHFISTVGLFSSPNSSHSVIPEDEILENSGTLYNGYAQSKWVAEKLIRLAELRGLPISIHRPNTEGHSKTGVFNHDDHLCKIIKGCIQLGSVPIDLDIVVASAPIDYVSKAIVYLSRRNESQGKAFHLVNPQPLKWNEWINRICSLGYSLKQLSYSEWKAELMNQIKVSQTNELYTLSPFFSDSMLEAVKMPVFDCKNTLHGLAETSIACPAIDSELLNTYFSYFRDSGFLPPLKTNGNSPELNNINAVAY
ncbi:thioester reductase domain-containing protein [Desmonostoc muscorum CCALA 125]|nr:thioester reductase domain-containing protein [Desmonostoc muscorum CCALA 125]